MEKTKEYLAGKPEVYFMEFKPYAPKEVIDAPFVQLVTIKGGVSDLDAAKAAIQSYSSKPGCTGATSGISVDDVDGSKIFVGVLGWESLDASKAANAEAVDIPGDKEYHHVNFRYVLLF